MANCFFNKFLVRNILSLDETSLLIACIVWIFIVIFFLDIDFWSEIGSETEKVDFMVDPLHLDRISYYLAYFGVGFEVLIDDVQTAIDNEETGKVKPCNKT